MSVYSSTKQHTIDPINHTKYRTEIRLPKNTVLTSDFKLMNLGFQSPVNNHLLSSTGTKSLIKKIDLFDGSEKLDSIQAFSDWSVYKEYNNDNESHRDMNNYMSGSSYGFTTRYLYNNTGSTELTDASKIVNYNVPRECRELEDNTFKGIINLQKELSFLHNSLIVPTVVFRDLRLVIEWERDLNNIFRVSPGAANVTMLRPYLVCKEITNEQMAVEFLKKYNGVTYNPIEMDTVTVPMGDAGTTQKINKKINGFKNKIVNKLVVQKKPSESVNTHVKKFCSVPQPGEKMNFMINGKKMLPYDGIDRCNKRLGMLSMAKGPHNTLTEMNAPSSSNCVASCSTDVSNLLVMDFVGLNIADRLSQLEIQYERNSYSANDASNVSSLQPLSLNVYGEVNKQVVMNGDKYIVEYQ